MHLSNIFNTQESLVNININIPISRKKKSRESVITQRADFEERLLGSPTEEQLCPASRYRCTFEHDGLTPEEYEIYQQYGTKESWEGLVARIETAQQVFDWMKVSLKGFGPNSCVPPAVALTNAAFVGFPFDVLNPLFYVEILVAGPCETFKPRIKTMHDRLNNIRKGAKGLAKLIKNAAINKFFVKTAALFDKPVKALKKLLDALEESCKKVSFARSTARTVLEIMNHVGTASGILGGLMDYYIQGVCSSSNSWVKYAQTRNANYGQNSNRRMQEGAPRSAVDIELEKQGDIIAERTQVPTQVYEFMQAFSRDVAPTLEDLKETWDRVEIELEDVFRVIEVVVEAFAPFDELFEILGNMDCSAVPVLSVSKFIRRVIAIYQLQITHDTNTHYLIFTYSLRGC